MKKITYCWTIFISSNSINNLTVFYLSVLSQSIPGLDRLSTELTVEAGVALQVDCLDVPSHVRLAGGGLPTLDASPELIKRSLHHGKYLTVQGSK